jgi:hypothetical protein
MNINFNYENKRSIYLEAATWALLTGKPDANIRDTIIDLAQIMGNYNVVSNSFDINQIDYNIEQRLRLQKEQAREEL